MTDDAKAVEIAEQYAKHLKEPFSNDEADILILARSFLALSEKCKQLVWAIKQDHWHDEYSEDCLCFKCSGRFDHTRDALKEFENV